MNTILTEWLGYLTGGISTMGEAIGKGISSIALNMFCNYTQATGGAVTITGLSTFGTITAIFAGIALAFGLTRLVFNIVKRH